jgi:hypothetical protein
MGIKGKESRSTEVLEKSRWRERTEHLRDKLEMATQQASRLRGFVSAVREDIDHLRSVYKAAVEAAEDGEEIPAAEIVELLEECSFITLEDKP